MGRHIVKYNNGTSEVRGLVLTKLPNIVVPSEYTLLTYLASNGTQWIDTGIAVTTANSATIKTELDFYITSDSATRGIFGIGGDNGYGVYLGANIFWDNYNDDIDMSISSSTIGHVTITKEAGNTSIVAGLISLTHTRPARSFNLNGTIYLFRKTGSGRGTGDYRFYYFKCWNDGVNLSAYFVPAKRNSDGELGMYDVVSNQFFTNAGTGTFLAGESLKARTINAIKTREVNN